jgi:Icc-related predicted phosphoesterase
MARAITTVLAIGPVRDDVASLERVLAQPDAAADAIAVVGDLGTAWSKRETYRALFAALGHTGLPTFWIPGAIDAPLGDHLREAYSMEIAFPHLRGVHGSFAYGPGPVVFTGMGGEILDDPEAIRDESAYISYPAWEVEYRLKVLKELKEHPMVFLHTTPPAHKGLHTPGSHVLATVIKTYNPRVAVVARDTPSEVILGKTLVVSPGRLDHGAYSVIDLHALTVERGTLEGAEVERQDLRDPGWLPRRAT